ncbi:transcriptional regulator [Clostridium botulinum]|uniref:transcriptional regulator n=1 Tax=Clostridium botulinum TaxID=1491 RepID=UPI0013F0DB79|nr:transcriptional regulator [Clostridium botulinum]MBY6916811.1 transcriptional regulator [Clostridium botulinum]NFL36614.1 transcriptional regulator [Clostridium botulinum]NFM02939.1 transcriptional regulator [Clostridium botulinum]NFO32195.1 transcriptional regulator [Clostridium botulinum]NFO40418.1 transcriptional regulator [Clostridium botulinum]
MDIKQQILNTLNEANKSLSAGEVEKLSGLDRKDIDKTFKELKKEELIISPVRCKWEPANK